MKALAWMLVRWPEGHKHGFKIITLLLLPVASGEDPCRKTLQGEQLSCAHDDRRKSHISHADGDVTRARAGDERGDFAFAEDGAGSSFVA
ncbi:hypothetical protein [Bradyrhizobium sp. STM 3557]|uniref:hypothetical protein n=1 Tax=Bradyrhizobium sp. STM 3557 TaxID=578920 RepID=UPI00388EA97E